LKTNALRSDERGRRRGVAQTTPKKRKKKRDIKKGKSQTSDRKRENTYVRKGGIHGREGLLLTRARERKDIIDTGRRRRRGKERKKQKVLNLRRIGGDIENAGF